MTRSDIVTIVIALAVVVAVLVGFKYAIAGERATLEVAAGLGSTSTRFQFPTPSSEYGGGDVRSVRAELAVPLTSSVTWLAGYRATRYDFGYKWSTGGGVPVTIRSARNTASAFEVGIRIGL